MGPRRRVQMKGSEVLATLAGLTGTHADFYLALATGHALLDEAESGIPGARVKWVTPHLRFAESDLETMIGLLADLEAVRLNRPSHRLVRRLKATTPDMVHSLADLEVRADRLEHLDSGSPT